MSAADDYPILYNDGGPEAERALAEIDRLRRPPRTSSEYPELQLMAQHGLSADDIEARDALDDIDSLHAAVDAQSDQLGEVTVLLIELDETLTHWSTDDDLPDFRQNEARDYARRVQAWLDPDGD